MGVALAGQGMLSPSDTRRYGAIAGVIGLCFGLGTIALYFGIVCVTRKLFCPTMTHDTTSWEPSVPAQIVPDDGGNDEDIVVVAEEAVPVAPVTPPEEEFEPPRPTPGNLWLLGNMLGG